MLENKNSNLRCIRVINAPEWLKPLDAKLFSSALCTATFDRGFKKAEA